MRLKATTKKILGDIVLHKIRFFFIFILLLASVTLLSFFFTGFSILPRESTRDFLSSNPASATLKVDQISTQQLDAVKKLPYISAARSGRTIETQISVNGTMKPFLLNVVDDWTSMKVSMVQKDSGEWSGQDQIMLESTTKDYLGIETGSKIEFRNSTGKRINLEVSGTVHDVTHGASSLEDIAYGYITLACLERIENDPTLNMLYIQVAEHRLDRDHIRAVSDNLSIWLNENGVNVQKIDVPPPNVYPHDDHMIPILYFLLILGFLSVIISGLLVSSIINTIISSDKKYVGILKTVGASTGQIVRLYMTMLLLLLSLAMCAGIPLGTVLGAQYMKTNAYDMNYRIENWSVEPYLFVLQVIICLVVTAVSAYPVLRKSCNRTIRSTLDTGISTGFKISRGVISSLVRKTGRVNLLSFRNTFIKRGRIFLMLTALATGGGLLMSAVNLRGAMILNNDAMFKNAPYSVEIVLSRYYPQDSVEKILQSITSVGTFETLRMTDGNIEELTDELVNFVGITSHDEQLATTKDIKRSIQDNFDTAGISIQKNQTLDEKKNIALAHDIMFSTMFASFSLILIFVGLLGLAATITINIGERTKEIGIIKTIGATGFQVFRMVVTESWILIFISWMISMVIAIPLTAVFIGSFSNILNIESLQFVYDLRGVLLWLGISLVSGTIAVVFPSLQAQFIPIRKAVWSQD
jgi:ABC-type antimicrobial peptide transport system permease subunit